MLSTALSEGDFLFGQFGCVLLRNVESVQLIKLLLFNSLNLATLVLNLLADLASFLEIVKSILLRLLVVGVNLGAELLGMLLKNFLLFLFNVSLLLFYFLLLLDYAEEFVTLLLSLLGKAGLSLKELSLASLFHILKHFLFVLEVPTFLLTSGSLALFEGSLRS